MKKYIPIILLSFLPLFGGCQAYRGIYNLNKQQTKIEEISTQINKINETTANLLKEQQAKIDSSVAERISVGAAQAISVLGTLQANPEKDKYTQAGIKGLTVTKEAMLDRVETKDLIDAIEIQTKLISEQADQIAEADKRLGILSTEIDARKQNEAKLAAEKEKTEREAEQQKAILAADRAKLQKEYDDYKAAMDKKNQEDAEKWRKDNAWYHRINPFRDFFSGIGKLLIWGAVFVGLGLILRLLSIIFPQVNIIQVFVKSIGRIFGVIIKALFGWIPDVLRGMNAVDYEKFKQEKTLNENTIGAVQEFKEKNPEEYKALLKSRLEEWNKENPELVGLVEEKLKVLNLK